MSLTGNLKYRLTRAAGRFVTSVAAILTLGRMPPFVSASAIVYDGERVLMVKDPIRGEFVLPGGHLRWRETPICGALREVREETGYIIEAGQLVGVYAGEELTGETGIVRVIYEGSMSGGSLRPSAEGEPAWLDPHAVDPDTRDGRIVREWLSARGLP